MNEYVIMTDSACDMSPALLAEWGVPFKSLTFRFDGSDQEYTDQDVPAAEFYAKMSVKSKSLIYP